NLPIRRGEINMDQQKYAVLAIASRLLSYPSDDPDEAAAIKACIQEDIESSALKWRLSIACSSLLELSEQERKETYVSTFDLKAKLGLYLTAHEFGDSNKRGTAIIQLQNTIRQAGFVSADEELADYIPMLLEFLVVSPENDKLLRRLAVAFSRMRNSISGENPYAAILFVLMEFVFPEPTAEEIKKMEFEREEADLENMPYPIMYQ